MDQKLLDASGTWDANERALLKREMQPMRWTFATLMTTAAALVTAPATAEPVIFGRTVNTYSTVPDAIELSFGSSGELFTGSSGATAKIHRVAPGGASFAEYGAIANADPDTVRFDPAGTISGGNPGAVLVAGRDGTAGYVRAILPDESQISIIADAPFTNPNVIHFDASGRLIIADNLGGVFAYDGVNPASQLYMLPARNGGLETSDDGHIYTAANDGVFRIHDAAGNLVDGDFYTDPTPASYALAFGPGNSWWGDELYAIDRGSGEMLRIDAAGLATVVGSGWNAAGDLEFGPDGAMYVSLPGEDRVVSIVPEPSSLALAALGGFASLLVTYRRSTRRSR